MGVAVWHGVSWHEQVSFDRAVVHEVAERQSMDFGRSNGSSQVASAMSSFASGVSSGCSRGKKAATTPTKAMRMTWATAPAAVPRTLKSCIAAAS